jgi:hypothetical protein
LQEIPSICRKDNRAAIAGGCRQSRRSANRLRNELAAAFSDLIFIPYAATGSKTEAFCGSKTEAFCRLVISWEKFKRRGEMDSRASCVETIIAVSVVIALCLPECATANGCHGSNLFSYEIRDQ